MPRLLPAGLLLLSCGLCSAQAPAPVAVAAASASASAAAEQRLTVQRDTLWNIAGNLSARYAGVSRAQIMVALLRANPDAFVQQNLHRLRVGVSLRLPSVEAVRAEPDQLAQTLVEQHRQAAAAAQPGAALPALALSKVEERAVAAPAPAQVPSTPVMEAPKPAIATPPARVQAPDIKEPASLPPQASAVVLDPSPAPDAAQPGVTSRAVAWLPYGLAGLLVLGVVLLWRQRAVLARVQGDDTGEVVAAPSPTAKVVRPQVVSSAAADMARTMEAAWSAHVMVRRQGDEGSVDALPVSLRRRVVSVEEMRLQLLMARAWIELGRVDSARALLRSMSEQAAVLGLGADVQALQSQIGDADGARAA
jgi:FimV-like protein